MCLILLLGAAEVGAIFADEAARQGDKFPSNSLNFDQPDTNGTRRGFSPNGKMRAETEFRKVKIWSVPENQLIHEFAMAGHSYTPTFSPDSSRVIVAECEGNLGCAATLRALNLKTKERSVLGKCTGVVVDMSFSQDGTRIAAVTSYSSIVAMVASGRDTYLGGELFVLDLKSGAKLLRLAWENGKRKLSGDGEDVAAQFQESMKTHMPRKVRLNHDGSKLCTTTSLGRVRVFDVETGNTDFDFQIDVDLSAEAAETAQEKRE